MLISYFQEKSENPGEFKHVSIFHVSNILFISLGANYILFKRNTIHVSWKSHNGQVKSLSTAPGKRLTSSDIFVCR